MFEPQARKSGWKPHAGDARGAYDVDYSRVIHSGSFRRLQGKTQILNLGDGDFYRTRLTHSLEVAQVGTGIVRQIRKTFPKHPCHASLPETLLIQAVCLTHDIGHPPFGHGGEVALNYCMRNNGGFEGNGQTLRVLSKLEKFSDADGADLTRRVLLGILKYPVQYKYARNPRLRPGFISGPTAATVLDRDACSPPKCYLDAEADVVEWLLSKLDPSDRAEFCRLEVQDDKQHRRTIHKSFDCSIMDLADDIGYGVHDLEDAIAMGLVSEAQFREGVPESQCGKFLDTFKLRYPSEAANDVYSAFVEKLFGDGATRKRQIGRLVGHFITNVEPYEVEGLQEPLLKFRVRLNPDVNPLLDALKKFVSRQVIKSPNVQQLEFKGQQMIVKCFEAFQVEPQALLPRDYYIKYQAEYDVRIISDFIAGMTDDYLMKTFERLYSPRMGSVFDRL